jgi:hypothetical protein
MGSKPAPPPELVTERRARAVRALKVVFWVAVAVSVVHYADNYFNYTSYPQSSSAPNPSRTLIALAWFGFTAVGLAGFALLARGPSRPALVLLALYSGSGLVGIGHYTVPGALDMPWWRQAHVVADIACALAIVALLVVLARSRRQAGRAAL